MNPTLPPARGPATRAAHALNDTMKEIAADVRELRAQIIPLPLPMEAVITESQDPAALRDVGMSVAKAGPPAVSEIPTALSRPAVLSETPTAVVSPSVPARERMALPPVVDLRPELAAFTAAVTQQQAATLQTLRQVTFYCQQQQAQMVRLSTELERLDSRLRNLAQR